MPTPAPRYLTQVLCLALAGVVILVYWPVGGFGFVNLDDPKYVYQNPRVRDGLTWSGVAWAFTAFHASNWHPLTWLSHMLDASLFGLDAGGHHLVNVALHAASTLLLFLLLRSATSSSGRSAFVAALFGIHPLHVESVAWVSERKDVLSTFFWLTALLAYVSYTRRPSGRRYLGVAGLFALGLLSKPMVVTFPVTLLLIDLWPLGRWVPGRPVRKALPLVREKLPLLALSFSAALVTILAQSSGGAISTVRALPMGERIANAFLSYGVYLGQTIWPSRLAAYYPHPSWTPDGIPWARAAASGLLLLGLSAVAIWQARKRPFLFAGWGWYVVTLLPVIGVVQVGAQAHADRYTYVPLIGIFWALAWSLPAFGIRSRGRLVAAGLAAAAVAGYAVAARDQVGNWRDTPTLLGRALAVTRHNSLAWGNLGTHYQELGDHERAAEALQEALRIDPGSANNWVNLGATRSALGQAAEAAQAFENGVRLAPADADAWLQLGLARLDLRQPAAAVAAFERAVELEEHQPTAWAGLAVSRALTGDTVGALAARDRLREFSPELAAEVDARLGAALRAPSP